MLRDISVLLVPPDRFRCFEEEFSFIFLKRTLSKMFGKERLYVGSIPKNTSYVLMVTSCDVVIPDVTPSILESVLKCKYPEDKIFSPSYNSSPAKEQVTQPPFPYLTLGGFNKAAELIRKTFKGSRVKVKEKKLLKDVLFLKGSLLSKGKDYSKLLEELEEVEVLKEWYVHKYGDLGFSSPREELLEFIPDKAKLILDVGAGGGGLGRTLKEKRPWVEIYAVEPNPFFASLCKNIYDSVFICNFEELELNMKFDAIIMGDVLEHMYDPWKALEKAKAFLRKEGSLILSVPNIRHWSIVKEIMENGFSYTPWGPLSVTHIRFFTKSDILELLYFSGFKVDKLKCDKIPFPPGEKPFYLNKEDGEVWRFLIKAKVLP